MGSDFLSGATVLEFHQIPIPVDYTSIVSQTRRPPSLGSKTEGGGRPLLMC